MIRIDEIYENTFLPWVKQNLPNTSIFYCDPFGRSDPDSIMCRGLEDSNDEDNAIFFFDQEPIQLSTHLPTFQSFCLRNEKPLSKGIKKKFLVTSEINSDNVDYICKAYGLQPFYYFFHGWAALDWYRGYDRTFLILPPSQRQIKKTLFSANRIIGGERSHRVVQLYFFQLFNLMHNHISAPQTCPVENTGIQEIAAFYRYRFPPGLEISIEQEKFFGGIEETVAAMKLPRLFPGEETQHMSSCWLDNFDLCAESMIYHVSETVFFGRRQHLTEKTFKPIALGMPFVLSAPAGSLQYLRTYGFQTFDSVWDESYDNVANNERRMTELTKTLRHLDKQSQQEKNKIFQKCIPIIEHNWNHFYGGGFEKILWAELVEMLQNLKTAAK